MKEKYLGIYINNKIPKLNTEKTKYNKYFNSIKVDFLGKATIIDAQNNRINIENNQTFNKKGKYIIEFINDNGEKYFFNVEIKKITIYTFIIVLFLFLIFLINFNNLNLLNQRMINEFTDINIDFKGIKYVFDVNYANTEFKEVKLTDTINEKATIYPGSEGYFFIQISTKNGNKDMQYNMEIINEFNKPQNLKFEYNNKIYESMSDLSKDINGTILKDKEKKIKIRWF